MDDLKAFNMDAIAPFYPGIDESKLANVSLRLSEGRTLTTKERRREMVQLNRSRAATKQLGRLPEPGESIHCVLNGSFALYDFIPAVLDLTGQPIDELVIATLGFSRKNVEGLSQLIDAGQIKRMAVLCSHYFSAQDSQIYSHMAELCARHSFPLTAMRSHAKILLMATGTKRLSFEASANLRSCFNVEVCSAFADADLYDFHRSWIFELLAKGATP